MNVSGKGMIKRGTDIFISLLALVLLFPVFLFILILVKKNIGSPVIFSQRRPGLNNTVFDLYKFRSMQDSLGEDGKVLPDKDRLTQFGRVLRSSSCDELPALWNVLKGDMSLVGPRPLLEEYLPLYSDRQARRHSVRPGITGWAQVNGRNAISWEEKFELDVWYVDNRSLLLDFRILIMTIKKVFMKEGINATEEVTMSRFQGRMGE